MITPSQQTKMSSIMRSQSMCPTGADCSDFEESVYDPTAIPEESIEIQDDITGKTYYMTRIGDNDPAIMAESITPEPKPMKKKIMAPPMQYDLRKANASLVYQHIKELTKNDQAAALYLEQIKPALYSPKPVVFGYIPAPPNEEITRKVIGSKGYFFKMTTTCCGVYFIWHDRDSNSFLFWGPSTFKTVKAMNSIRWRIIKYCELAQDETDDDETDDDMPGLVSMDEIRAMDESISMGNTPDYEHPEPC